MKSGKIILGAAAAVVTVGSALAFRVAHKNSSRLAYGATQKGSPRCLQCMSLYTGATGVRTVAKCHTNSNGVKTLWATRTGGVGSKTKAFRTNVTQNHFTKCNSSKVTKVTFTI